MCNTSHFRHYSEEVSRANVASAQEAPLLLLDLNSSLPIQEWTILPHLQVSCYFYQRKLSFSIHRIFHKHLAIQTGTELASVLIVFPTLVGPPEDAERLPTWLFPALSCVHWTQTRPQGSPKQSDKQKMWRRDKEQQRNTGRQVQPRSAEVMLKGLHFSPRIKTVCVLNFRQRFTCLIIFHTFFSRK